MFNYSVGLVDLIVRTCNHQGAIYLNEDYFTTHPECYLTMLIILVLYGEDLRCPPLIILLHSTAILIQLMELCLECAKH